MSDFSQLVGFEDAAAGIGATSEVSVRRFTQGRATLAMRFKHPVELLERARGAGAVRVPGARHALRPGRFGRRRIARRGRGRRGSFSGVEELTAPANGIEIVYQAFGDPADPTMLLIMGLGVQMLGWDTELCELLAGRGFQVVRFDNRDVGRSSKIRAGLRRTWWRRWRGTRAPPATRSPTWRRLRRPAGSSGGGGAHLVGASQGGMIGQTMAIERPERVLSLTSIMSTTGDPSVGQPHPEALPALLTRPPADREGFAEFVVRAWRVIGSPGFDADEDALRARARTSYDRGHPPEGHGAPAGRDPGLRRPDGGAARPAGADGVIHGDGRSADRRLRRQGDRGGDPGRGAGADRGDGPRPAAALWPRFVDLIVANAERARTFDSAA